MLKSTNADWCLLANDWLRENTCNQALANERKERAFARRGMGEVLFFNTRKRLP